MTSSALRERFRKGIDGIRVIDSHEHTESLDFTPACENHLFRILCRSFIENDLTRSGATIPRWKIAAEGSEEGWLSLRRFIGLCRNTGYLRSFLIAVRDLFGFPDKELNDQNWESISHAVVSANRRPDWYRYVLRERANIDVVLWDLPPKDPGWPNIDRTLFLPLERLDGMSDVSWHGYRQAFAQEFGIEPRTVDDVLGAMDQAFQDMLRLGAAGVKIAAAYFRPIGFRSVAPSEASRVLNMVWEDRTEADIRAYQDFIFSQIIERCAIHSIPIQIHTGMQAVGKGPLHNGDPMLLEETVARHRDAQFVLLHGGYPFVENALSLTARHPNVFLDMSWLPILSPSAYSWTLRRCLDGLPVHKIIAWGGDAARVEMSYGSLIIAKNAITAVLAHKIETGALHENRALDIAARILRENARHVFRTDEIREHRLQAVAAAESPT